MSLSLEKFEQVISEEDVIIIDTRTSSLFLEGYIPTAIHFKPEIIQQAAALGLFTFNQPLVFVGADAAQKVAIDYFEKLGFVNIKGYLEGGFDTWRNANKRYDLVIEVEADELAMDIQFDEYLMVVDIRTEALYDQEHIKDSINIPILDFADPGSMSEFDEHFNIYIVGENGDTNTLAASILKKQGIHNIRIVQEGWEAIKFLKDKFKIEATKSTSTSDESDIV